MIRALVLGGAESVWDDLEQALGLGEFDQVYTVNDITTIWRGDITACVSLHAEKWPYWLEQRRRNGLLLPNRVIAHLNYKRSMFKDNGYEYHDHLYPGQVDSGSSGLFAVKVALDGGADRVVVCGCPMQEEFRHYFDYRPWGGAQSHRRGWLQIQHRLKSRVRSMSGWTEQLLGRPTEEWMEICNGEEQFKQVSCAG